MDLVICELYNPVIHCYDYTNNITDWENICMHWLNIKTFSKNSSKNKIKKFIKLVKNSYKQYNLLNHPYIQNYNNIILNKNYLQLHLAKNIVLDTGETICIIKTYWIRIIQRTWKRIYKERQLIIQQRKNPLSILYFQQNGKWPKDCFIFPSLKIP
jgi:hypothetical protein